MLSSGEAQLLGAAQELAGALSATRPVCNGSVLVIVPVYVTLPAQGVDDGSGVLVAVLVGARVPVAVGGGAPVQEGNLNEPTRVRHVRSPVTWIYSVVYQKVQSSAGSTVISL